MKQQLSRNSCQSQSSNEENAVKTAEMSLKAFYEGADTIINKLKQERELGRTSSNKRMENLRSQRSEVGEFGSSETGGHPQGAASVMTKQTIGSEDTVVNSHMQNRDTVEFENLEKLVEESVDEASEDGTATATAIHDFEAEENDEVSFESNDQITNIKMFENGWWYGKNVRGEVGLFPANHVVLETSL